MANHAAKKTGKRRSKILKIFGFGGGSGKAAHFDDGGGGNPKKESTLVKPQSAPGAGGRGGGATGAAGPSKGVNLPLKTPPPSPSDKNLPKYVSVSPGTGSRTEVSVISTPSGLTNAPHQYHPIGGVPLTTGQRIAPPNLLPPMYEDDVDSGGSSSRGKSLISVPHLHTIGNTGGAAGHHNVYATRNNQLQFKPNLTTQKKKRKGSFFTRSKAFRKMSRMAFHVVDSDDSGTVDKTELYAGLLIIHLRLATYAGPAACRPVTRDYANEVFDKMDTDNSGTLCEDEFVDVMVILFSSILTRVAVQWTMTLLIVPLLAKHLVDGLSWAFSTFTQYWYYDERLVNLRAFVEDLVEHCWKEATLRMPKIPDVIFDYYCRAGDLFHKAGSYVPDSVVETLPLTSMSVILGSLLVPFLLLKIDRYFHKVADKRATEE